MQQADDWLEVSESSAKLAQQALQLGISLGARIDTQVVDGLIDEIASLRGELGDATKLVENLHERAAAMAEGEVPQERVQQAIELAVRVAATLSSIDARLDRFGDRLLAARENVQELQSGTLGWIRIAAIMLSLLIAWMGAGQLALCYFAWNWLQRIRRMDQSAQSSPQ